MFHKAKLELELPNLFNDSNAIRTITSLLYPYIEKVYKNILKDYTLEYNTYEYNIWR